MIKTFIWIIPIIESCKTPEHLECVKVMAAQFVKMFPEAIDHHEVIGEAISEKEVMMLV